MAMDIYGILQISPCDTIIAIVTFVIFRCLALFLAHLFLIAILNTSI